MRIVNSNIRRPWLPRSLGITEVVVVVSAECQSAATFSAITRGLSTLSVAIQADAAISGQAAAYAAVQYDIQFLLKQPMLDLISVICDSQNPLAEKAAI